jgi:DNA-binding NarL/FixJ family response regulator
MRVVLIEDQVLLRSTLVKALEQVSDIKIVAHSEKASEAAELCQKHRPDLVVMDIFTAEGNGLDYIAVIKKTFPDIKVFVMTEVENEQLVQAAEKAGADLFAWKNLSLDEFTDLIRYSTKPYRVFPKPLNHLQHKAGFSEIEIQIISLLSQGKSTREIAAEKFLEYGTVRVYISRMYSKTGLRSRAQLVAYALRCGLIESV